MDNPSTISTPMHIPFERQARNHRKVTGGIKLLAIGGALLVGASPVSATPTGGQVVAGSATIVNSGATTTITAANNTIINFSSFNVGAAQTVDFIQPTSTSTVLNRVTGSANPSQIFGTIEANGIVYLVNPAGVFFGANSVVNVGGLFAAAGSISDQDFLAKQNHFSGLIGSVVNQGSITSGSTAALVGAAVANSGTVVTKGGTIALVAGNEVYVGESGNNTFVNAGPATQAGPGIQNTGTLSAGSGTVALAAGDLYSLAIQQSGAVQGRTISVNGGSGQTVVSGSLDASSTSSSGGSITVTGGSVDLAPTARLNASGVSGGGTILVGGGLHGADTSVSNASTTTVEAGASLLANAGVSGNGGSVVVWSNDTTNYAGALSAKGGASGGNGGFAEVSGKGLLNFSGSADLTAPAGAMGTLLLDPLNITIGTTAAVNGTSGDVTGDIFSFQYPGVSSQITATAVGNLLNTASLLLQATNNITVSSPISWTSNTGLTLQATNAIAVNAAITNSGTAGTFTTYSNSFSLSAGITVPNVNIYVGTSSTGSFTATSGASIAGSTQIDGQGSTNTFNLSGFTNLNATVTGGTVSNTLTGPSGAHNWDITSNNSGTVGGVTFVNIESLVDTGAGDFVFANKNAALTGSIASAGAGTLDYSSYVSPVTFNVTSGASTAVTAGTAGITTVIDSAGSNTIAGVGSTYSLTGSNQGNNGAVSWSAFGSINDATGSVNFGTAGTLSGSVKASSLNYGTYSNPVTVDLTGNNAGTATGIGGTFSSVATITGNASQSNTVGGTGLTYTLVNGTANAGSADSVSWTNFGNISDSTGTVNFGTSGDVSGSILAKTLNFSAYGTGISASLTGANSGTLTAGIGGSFSGVSNLNANSAATNTIGGSGQSYVLDNAAANKGVADGITWTNFQNLSDATGSVNFSGSGDITGNVAAGTLNFSGYVSNITATFTAANSGTVSAGIGGSFSGVGAFNANGLRSNTLDGTGLTYSLDATTSNKGVADGITWTGFGSIGDPTGTLVFGNASFLSGSTDVGTLNYGSYGNAVTLTITGSGTATINAGIGGTASGVTDVVGNAAKSNAIDGHGLTYVLNNTTANEGSSDGIGWTNFQNISDSTGTVNFGTAGSISGNVTASTLDYSSYLSNLNLTISGPGAGSVGGIGVGGTISGVTNFYGNSAKNNTVGGTGLTYALANGTPNAGSADSITWTNFQNINDAAGTINLGTSGSITGIVDVAALNFSTYGSAVSVTLNGTNVGTATGVGTFTGVSSISGNAAQNNTMGGTGVDYVLDNSVHNKGSADGVAWTNFGNINDSTGTVSFGTGGFISGNVTASTLDYSSYLSALTLTVSGPGSGSVGGIGVGGTISGVNTFSANSAYANSVHGSGLTYTLDNTTPNKGSADAINWTNFQNISDATGTVNFGTGGSVTGNVTAATLNYGSYLSALTLTLTGSGTGTVGGVGVGGSVSGVSTFIANSAYNNTVGGTGLTYLLDNVTPNKASADGIAWTNFQNISDSTGTINFGTGGSVTGNVRAATLNYGSYLSALTLTISGAGSGSVGGVGVGGTVSGVSTFIANSAYSNTVDGTGLTYALDNSTPNKGSSDGINWTSFQNINDATGTVNFGTGGTVTGNVAAQSLNLGSYAGGVSATITGANAGSVSGVVGTFSGVSAITANSAKTNTIGGSGLTYALANGTPNAGTVDSVGYTHFQNIADATGTVNFGTSGSLTGNVTAASLNYGTYGTAVTLNTTGAGTTGIGGTWSGVTSVTGSPNSDLITGGTGLTYNLTGSNAGNEGTLSWTSFENINDATGTLNFGTVGSLSGTAAVQTLNYSAYGSNVTATLTGSGSGSATGLGGFTGVGAINANGSNSNTIGGSGLTYILDASTANKGSADGVTWTSFQGITDSTGTVNFNTGGSVTGAVAVASLNYSNYGTPVTFGISSGTATGVGSWTGVTSVTGSAHSDLITGSGLTYNLTAANAGNSGAVSWTSFENITDATGDVNFLTAGSVSGSLTAATLNYGTYASNVTATLTGANAGTATGIGGTFGGVSTLAGNAAGSNTIGGNGVTYVLANGTPNAGSADGVSWTNFKNISDSAGTVNFNTAGSVTGNIVASALNYGTYGGNVTATLAGSNAGTATGIGGAFSGVASIAGNAADSNTIAGSGLTYLLANGTPNAGSADGVSWTNFKNVSDTTGTVNFNASGSVTGNVLAQVLNYSTYGSGVTLTITGPNAGTLSAGIGGSFTGVSAVNADGSYNNTVGGSGLTYLLDNTTQNKGSADAITWTNFQNISDAAGTVNFNASGSVSGNVLASTLNYGTYLSALTLTISGPGAGSVGGMSVGGTISGVSTFIANSAFSNTVDGTGLTYALDNTTPNKGSADSINWTNFQNLHDATGTVNFGTGGSVSGSILASVLNYGGYGSNVTASLTGANAGTATGIGGAFSGVATLTGNAANSNTIGGSGLTYLLVNGTPNAGSADSVAWTNFRNISDATGTVNFGTSGSVTGNVLAATLNLGSYASDVTAGITGANAGTVTGIGGTFTGVSTLTGNAAGNNTVGGNGLTYVLVNGTPNAGSADSVAWTNFKNISDSAGTVNFSASGGVTGNVTAAALTYASYGSPVTFNLTGAGTTGIGGTWSGVTSVTGSANSDLITGGSGLTYNLTGANTGNVGSIGWSSFENITDATGTLNFGTVGTLAGNAAVQTLNYSSYASGVTATLTGPDAGSATGLGSFTGVNAINANGSQSNAIHGSGFTYLLDASSANKGSSEGITWTNFQNIADATGTVNFNTGGSLTGNVLASGLNYGTYASNVTVFLTGAGAGTATGIGGTFSGVSTVAGNAAETNTVGGSGLTYVLVNGTPNSGSADSVAWTNFKNISDSTGTVNFGTSGTLTGVAAVQTLNYATYGSNVTATLTGPNAGSATGLGAFTGVSSINANAANNNTIAGTGFTYLLDASVANKGSSEGVTWTAFNNVADTTGTVNFNTAGSVTGNVSAEILNYANYATAVTLGLTSKTATGIGGTWSGVTSVTGSANSDLVAGTGLTYSLTGANAGNSGAVSWTSFENITDATGLVNFGTVGSVSGNITAATLNYGSYASNVAATLTGAKAGTSTGIGGTFSGVSTLTGNAANSNTIGGSGLTYVLVNGTPNAGSADSVAWTNFQNISDATGNVSFGTSGSVTGNVLASTLNYSAYASNVMATLTGANAGTATGIGGTFGGVSTLTGNAANSNTIGGSGLTYLLVNGTPNAGSADSVAWTNFKNIADATGTVNFGTNGSVTGNVLASDLNYGAYGSGITVTLTGLNSGTVSAGIGGTFSGVSAIAANAAFANTMSGTGYVYLLDPSVANQGSSEGVAWTAFQNIADATGAVNFNTGGSVTGSVTASTLNYSSYAMAVTVGLTSKTASGIGGTWSGVTSVTGSANSDLLTGTGLTYNLAGANAGNSGAVSWTSFENITDATGFINFGTVGSISGSVTASTLNYGTYGANVTATLTGPHAGTATGIGGTFSGVATLTGNAANSNTIGGSGLTYVLVNGTPDAGSADSVAWTNFKNISDATGTVNFGGSGSVTGNILASTLNYGTYAGNVTATLTGANAGTATGIGGSFSGVAALTGNAAGSNTIAGTGLTYVLANATPNAGSADSVSWTNFRNITDATGTVNFSASGSLTGNVTAASLDYATYGTAVTLNLTGAGTTGIGGTWTGVTSVTGSANSDLITGGSGLTYNLTGANAGNEGAVSWTSFENIADSTGTVNFGTVGTLSGNAAVQVLNYSTYAGAVTATLTGANAGSATGLGSFTGVSAINANSANNNAIDGTGFTYLLDASTANKGSSQGVTWTNFQNIADTTGTVNFNTGGSISGNVLAATLNYGAYTSNVTATLTGANSGTATGIGGSFGGVSTLTGNAAGNNTVAASGLAIALDNTTPNKGSGDGVTWTNFQNINDPAGTINFGTGGDITGNLTAATLNYGSYLSALTLTISGPGAGSVGGVGVGGTISGVSTFIANSAFNNHVDGSGLTYLLAPAVANAGSADGISWTNFQNITDATGTVNFNTGGSVTGSITAASLNYANYAAAVTVGLTSKTATGIGGTWTGVTSVTGSANSDLLTGTGLTYNLTGANAGSSGTVSWSSFENITDATGLVNFGTVGSVAGNVTAATLNYGSYGTNVAATLTGANAGTATGIGGAFSGVSTLTGNAANSNTVGGSGLTYVLVNGTPNAGSADAVSWTNFSNISDATGTVNFGTSGSVTGNVLASTLNYGTYATNVSATLTGANAGTATGIGGTFGGVTTLTGKAANSNTVGGSGLTYVLVNGTPNAGSADAVAWTNFRNISDATGTVNFGTSGSVTGNVLAADLNYGTYGSAITVTLSGPEAGSVSSGIGGTFSGVSTVAANTAFANTIAGSGFTYLLDASVANKGSSEGITWTAFKNIADPTGTVNFNTGGSVTGNVTAANLTYINYATPVAFGITSNTASGIGGTWTGVTSVTGSANSDLLTGTGLTYTLTGSNAGNAGGVAWTSFENITDATGVVNFGSVGSVSGSITAATLNYGSYASNVTATLTGANAGTATGIGGTFSGVATLTGNAATSNTIGGSGLTYVLVNGTPNAGSADSVSWTNFQNILDTTGTVNFGTSGSVTGNVTAATLNYGSYLSALTLTISGPGAGSVGGVGVGGTISGVSSFIANSAYNNHVDGSGLTYLLAPTVANSGSADGISWTNFQNITDATGSVNFNTAGSVTGNIVAQTLNFSSYASGLGVTITAPNSGTTTVGIGGTFGGVSVISANAAQTNDLIGTGLTYSLTGVNAGTADGISWTAIQNLVDNAAGDFKMHSGADGSITGNLIAVGGTVDYTGYVAPVTFGLNGSGTTGVGGTWLGISTAIGTGIGSTIAGSNATYNLTSLNAGNSGTVTWTSFGNLSDSAAGIFKMHPGTTDGSVSGSLSAVGGTIDYTNYSVPVTFNLSSKTGTGIGGTWAGLATALGNTQATIAGSGVTYHLTGSNAGNNGTVAWTSFQNVADTTGTVNFGTIGAVTGNVLAATLDFSTYAANQTATLTGANAGSVSSGIGGTFSGVSAIKGNSANPNTIAGSGLTYTLDPATADKGSAEGITWTAFQNITDATGTVVFGNNSLISQNVGAETLNYSGYGNNLMVTISGANTGTASGIGGIFAGVSAIDANTAKANTVGGNGLTYSLIGANTGKSDGIIWTGVQNLDDQGAGDFLMNDGVDGNGSVTGSITAVGGTLDYTHYTVAATFNLTGTATGIGGSWNGITSVLGSSAGGNTITGGSGLTYNLTGTNAGNTGGIGWTSFQNITDAGAADFLMHSGADGGVTGTLAAVGGTMDYSNYVLPVSFNLGGTGSTGAGAWTGISTVIGSLPTTQDTIVGKGATYSLTGTDQGASNGVSWTNFGNVTDQGGGTIGFGTSGGLSGSVTGSGNLALDYSSYGSVTVNITGTKAGLSTGIAGSFTGVGSIAGNLSNANTNNITGAGLTYYLTGIDSGNSDGVSWSEFANIFDGGAGYFHMHSGADGSVTGTILAVNGTVDYTGYVAPVTFGLNGTATGIAGGWLGISSVIGSSNGSTILGSNATYNLTALNAGNSGPVSWTSFGNITDTGAGIFKMHPATTDGSVSGNLAAVGGTIDYTNYTVPVNFNLTADTGTGIGGTWSGLTTAIGNTQSTIAGGGVSYNLTGSNAGNNGTVAWTSFENIADATGAVYFGTVGSVTGNVMARTLDYSVDPTTLVVSVSGTHAGTATSIGGTFSGVSLINGNSAISNTIGGSGLTYNLTGANAGNTDGIAWTNIQNVSDNGAAAVNFHTAGSDGSLSGSVTAVGGSFNYAGYTQAVDFNLTGTATAIGGTWTGITSAAGNASTSTISGGVGLTYNLTGANAGNTGGISWTSFQNITDGGAADFNMHATADGSVTGTLAAVGGTLTYTGYTVPVTFNLGGTATGVGGWSGITTVVGTTLSDTIAGAGATYNLTGANAGNSGGISWTLFDNVADATGTLNLGTAGTLTGNAGVQTLNYSTYAANVSATITGANAGTATGLGSFTGVSAINANAANSNTVGGSGLTYLLDNTTANKGSSDGITWTAFQNILDASGTVNFASSGYIAGNVTAKTLNYGSFATNLTVGITGQNKVTVSAGIGGTPTGVSVVIGDAAQANTIDGSGLTYNLTGANAGNSDGVSWTNFKNLADGGAGVFNFHTSGSDGSVTGAVAASGGTLNYTGFTTAVSFNVNGTATGIGAGWTGITTLVGNAATTTVTGGSGLTYNLTGLNAGNEGAISWTSVQNLTDSGAATFNLHSGANGSVSGALTAVGGTMNYAGYTTAVTFNVGGTATGVGSWNGITKVVGSSNSDTIAGSGATYNLTGANAGNSGAVSWTSFENLADATGTANFGTVGTLSGNAAVATLNYASYASNVTATFTGANAGTATGVGSFSGVTTLNANAAQNNTVAGSGLTYVLDNTTSNKGVADGVTWTAFQNIADTTGTVNFATSGFITGNVTVQKLDYGSFGSNLTLGINGENLITVSGGIGGTPIGVSQVNGNASKNNVIDGTGLTYNLTGSNAGNSDGVAWTNIQSINDAGAAVFNLHTSGSDGGETGSITAVGGSINYAGYSTAVTDTLASASTGSGTGIGSFAGIAAIAGNGASGSTLVGAGTASTWTATGANAGTYGTGTGTLLVSGFPNWTGGAGTNTFNFTGGSLSGTLNGGTGTSALNITAATAFPGNLVNVGTVNINTTGAVSFSNPFTTGAVTVTNSGGTTFGGLTAGTVTLTNTNGTVTFGGGTTITTVLVTTAQPYNVTISGGPNSIAGYTVFLNTGTVTLSGGPTTFVGGAFHTAGPNKVSGTVITPTGYLYFSGIGAVGPEDLTGVTQDLTGAFTYQAVEDLIYQLGAQDAPQVNLQPDVPDSFGPGGDRP